MLLEQFSALQTEVMKELALIDAFKGATIEKKRMMWQKVCATIEAGYSKRANSIDLAKLRNWGKIDNFLENSFSGGTDGEEMLAEAINNLHQ